MTKESRLTGERPCKACGAQIGFVETAKSRVARLDNPELKPKSHVVDAKPELRITAAGESVWVYTSHFVTCPRAGDFRKAAVAGSTAKPPEGPERHPFQGEPCRNCGKSAALAQRVPVCVACWNGMSAAAQAALAREAADESATLAAAEKAAERGGCRVIETPGGGRAIVCGGRRGRSRR